MDINLWWSLDFAQRVSHAVHSPLQDLGGSLWAVAEMSCCARSCLHAFLSTQESSSKCKEVSEAGDSLIPLTYEKCESSVDSSILLHLVMTHCGRKPLGPKGTLEGLQTGMLLGSRQSADVQRGGQFMSGVPWSSPSTWGQER